jgi:hypothetical protein
LYGGQIEELARQSGMPVSLKERNQRWGQAS